MSRKSRVKKSMIFIIALLLIIYIISDTFARYTTSVSTNAVANIAKWAVALKQGDTPVSELQNLTFTVQQNEYVVDGKIAPGVTATSVVTLELNGTEVAVDIEANIDTSNSNLPAGVSPEVSIRKVGGSQDLEGSTIELPETGGVRTAFGASDVYNITITLAWANNDANNSGDTAIGIVGANITIPVTITVKQHVNLSIGDTVNYTTTLNGQTLDNWKVFYVAGNYTYIILVDYLPRSAISNTIRSNYHLADGAGTTYNICSTTNRVDLINAMITKDNWSSLLTGTINGHAVNEAQTANVWAMGTPTIDLWVNSWNASYSNDTLYITYANPVVGKTYDGYYIGLEENPETTNSYYVNISNGNALYFPHTTAIDGCYGYWLASPSVYGEDRMLDVDRDGRVDRNPYSNTALAVRPVVCLPTSVVNQ